MTDGTEIRIRRMTADDISQVAALEAIVFSEPWSLADFQKEAETPEHCYLVAVEEDGLLLGYCGCWEVAGEGQIYNVAVREESRGLGIGKKLLAELLRQETERGIREFTLEVRADNEPAIRLYHSLGFEDAGIRKNFYTKPTADALIMWRKEITDA